MIFYDFEVFKYDWLAVFVDMTTRKEHVIINDPEALKILYELNCKDIWSGYNNKHYDQYIFKGILLGMDLKDINDRIIINHEEGWQISSAFNKIQMINYDVMPSNNEEMATVGLKTLEGFMGSDIQETEVPFDIDRKLTPAEIERTVFYCRHDVHETIKVFMEQIDQFNAMYGIVKAFPHQVSIRDIGDTEARITSKVLGCVKTAWDDEFAYTFLPCLRLKKYKYVQDWFRNAIMDCSREMQQLFNDPKTKPSERHKYDVKDLYWWSKYFYSRSLTTTVAGIPHTFGFGGLHGAPDQPIHVKGQLLHVDVNNYYPSMLIAWDLVTRTATNDNYTVVYKTRKALKVKQQEAAAAGDKAMAKHYKKQQLPYKKMLNALSGAMKDKANPAFDPRNNNSMCINGQLMLLDLIEHLEVIPGFQLIQSNTDGLIILVPDTDEAFDMVDDICWEWEQRCSTEKCEILLALDNISEIFQKDVNNYLWIGQDGSVERIGAYLKELSRIDNDLPILNKAVVDFMVKKVPVEKTISECTDLLMFQKIVKLSGKYKHVEHETGVPTVLKVTNHRDGSRTEVLSYPSSERHQFKCYRVFASRIREDGRLMKCGGSRGKPEKFGGTPDHCFVDNSDMTASTIPAKLDREWYIQKAKERLKAFGITV